MNKHSIYKDIKNSQNYQADVVGVRNSRTIVIQHNEKRFLVKNNASTNIINILNENQIERLSKFIEKDLKDVIFNIKVRKKGILPNVEITIDNQEEKLPAILDKSVKRFIDSERSPTPLKYLARLSSYKDDNRMVVSTNTENYQIVLDLNDTNYSQYNESDQTLINNVIKDKLKKGNLVRISSDCFVGFDYLSKVEYKKNGYWENLGKEIKELINPYEETCSNGNQIFKGIITNILDGDTVELFNGIKKIRIRLSDIDAPESKQIFGYESTVALTKLIFGKEVMISYTEVDDYERIVGTIFTEDEKGDFTKDINRIMVKEGNAWAVDARYEVEQREARGHDKGLWVDDPVYPKNFRGNEDYFKNKQKPQWKKNQEKKAKKLNKKSFFNKKN